MARRIVLALACIAAMAAAGTARAAASLTLEGDGGFQSFGLSTQDITAATNGRSGTWLLGGRAQLDLGTFGVALGLDKTLHNTGPEPWAVFANVGPIFDIGPAVRFLALGEVGRSGFGSLGNFSFSNSNGAYYTYLGIRPGLAFRLGEGSPVSLGVQGIARWPLESGHGSGDYGALATVGIELGAW